MDLPRGVSRNGGSPNNASQHAQFKERKNKGLCITCGEVDTHRRGIWGYLVPVDNDDCFKQNMCRRCFKKIVDQFGNGNSEDTVQTEFTTHASMNNSGSLRGSGSSLISGKPSRPQTSSNPPSTIRHSNNSSSDGDSTWSRKSADRSTVNSYQLPSPKSTAQSSLGSSQTETTRSSSGGSGENSSSHSRSIISFLPQLEPNLRNVRASEELITMPLRTFPSPVLKRGDRDVQVKVSDCMNSSSKWETIYLVKRDRQPSCVYRKVAYPPVSEMSNRRGTIVFCLALPRNADGVGYIEPLPQDQPSHLKMIQKFPKKRYHGLCDGESPLKDVTVLQQLGDGDRGILECTEALEDERYIYAICEIDRFHTLGETSIPAPAQQKHDGSREERVKSLFQQLVLAVERIHSHGVCHRNLCQEVILCKRSRSSSLTLLLSAFHASLLVPISRENCHWINTRGMILSSKRECMSPELYGNQIFNGFAADIWSLGIILFQLLTGGRLHATPSRMDPKYCHFIVNSGFVESHISDQLIERLSGDSNNRHSSDFFEALEAVTCLSLSARKLLKDLLQEDPRCRLTPSEILNHPWLYSHKAKE